MLKIIKTHNTIGVDKVHNNSHFICGLTGNTTLILLVDSNDGFFLVNSAFTRISEIYSSLPICLINALEREFEMFAFESHEEFCNFIKKHL